MVYYSQVYLTYGELDVEFLDLQAFQNLLNLRKYAESKDGEIELNLTPLRQNHSVIEISVFIDI